MMKIKYCNTAYLGLLVTIFIFGNWLHHSADVQASQLLFAANEGLVRIQYKCLVPIYVFQDIKLHGLVISKTEL